MPKGDIERENHSLLERQRQFRAAADVVVEAWMAFPEVRAIAIIGSVAVPLWKEVLRFREYRRRGIELWHECHDLNLALWIESQDRLGELRRARDHALRMAYEAGTGLSVVGHQVDVFLFEPGTNRYLGRLCSFAQCPKGKRDCLRPGCGAVPFNKVIPEFEPRDDLLAPAVMLYERSAGRQRRAVDLPATARGSRKDGPR